MEHISIPVGEIHIPHNWEFASAAGRTGAAISDATLIGCIALQLDDGSYWRLTAVSPAAWEPFVEWDSLPGKPSVFPPSDHTHDFTDLTGLQVALDSKVDEVVGKGLSTEDYSTAEKSKLAGIAAGATVNSTDAELRDRTSHTGEQAIGTVTGLQTALDTKASTTYVDTQVAALVDSSPATLDTLNELAAALGDDPNFAATLATQIGGKESTITVGTTAQYWRGDKSWRDFATDVRATVLAGLSLVTSTAVTAADTVLIAFGKLQAQIDAAVTDLGLKAPLASPTFSGLINSTAAQYRYTGAASTAAQAWSVIGTSTAQAYGTMVNTSGGLLYGVDSSAGGALFSGTLAYSSSIGTTTATALHFGTNNAVRATISSAGNLLVGTTTDDATNKLQVNGGAKASGTITGGILTSFGASAGLIYSNNSSGSANSRNFVFGQTNSFGVLDVRIGATLGSDALSGTILQSWSAAGISMAVPLAVTGAISSTSGMTASTYSTNNTGTSATYTKLSNTGGDYYYGVENSAGSFFSGTAYAAVTYAPAGRVIQQIIVGTGVITTASAAGFAVTGLASATGGMAIPLDVYFNTNSSNSGVGWGITENSSTGYLLIAQRTGVGAYSNKMAIGTTGNVMIATTTDDGVNKLQVAGSIAATGQLTCTALSTGSPSTKTGNYTVLATDTSLILNGGASITLTLPTASSFPGRWLCLKNIAAFTVISASSNVVPQAGGAAGTAILAATAGKWAALQSDGTNWQIMTSN